MALQTDQTDLYFLQFKGGQKIQLAGNQRFRGTVVDIVNEKVTVSNTVNEEISEHHDNDVINYRKLCLGDNIEVGYKLRK